MKYAFQHDGKAFILKAEDGSTVRVGPRHEKYDYVQGVEAGRVIGISKSGRWTNAKDYDELYDKVSLGELKPSKMKFLVSAFNDLSLDRSNATQNGSSVHAWSAHGQINQAWYYAYGVIRSAENPDFCLDVEGGKYVNGAKVHLWKCHGGNNQKWVFDNGIIRSYGNPEFCLDIDAGCHGKDGGRVGLWACHGGKNQTWDLLSASQLAKKLDQSRK